MSTASRALSGRRRVDAAIVERVRAAAERLHYRPNDTARALRMSRTMTFGVVFTVIGSPVALDLIDGLVAGAHERGYSLVVTSARGQGDLYQMHIDHFMRQRADGLLLVGPTREEPNVEPFRRAGIPVLALVARGALMASLPLVTVDEEQAIQEAVDRMAALGHRTVGYALNNPQSISSRRLAVMNALQARGGTLVLGRYRDLSQASGERVVDELLSHDPRPTVIMAPFLILPRVLAAVRARGLRVPEDLSLVTFTDSRWAEGVISPPVAAIHSDTFEMGMRSAALLASLADGEEDELPGHIVGLRLAEWIDAPSLGPAPAG